MKDKDICKYYMWDFLQKKGQSLIQTTTTRARTQ